MWKNLITVYIKSPLKNAVLKSINGKPIRMRGHASY